MMKALFRPIDAAVLSYFRIGAGILMSQELINGLLIGKFDQYVTPEFNFSYLFFYWVKPWPYWGMAIHYTVTIFAGLAVAFNFHYRVFSIVLFGGQLLLFLFEQTEYINHSYLYCLLSFWMIFMPLDERRTSGPAWLRGTPMNIFLALKKDGLLGFLYDGPWAPGLYSYGGVIFDLFIIPLLLWRRTRPMAFAVAVVFHLSNAVMFGLATFPWFSIFLSTMFFESSFPRRIPILRKFLPRGIELAPEFSYHRPLALALVIYCCAHTVLPLRHFLYPGLTSWTEQGHMFAWRMMLRHKEGKVFFFVKRKKDGQVAFPDPLHFLTPRQLETMKGRPDLILQFAHFLRDRYERKWNSKVSVFASARIGLNGRKLQELIVPGTDLAQEKRGLLPDFWITQLKETPSKFRYAEFD